MEKPIIVIDIDDVLAAHAEGFVEFSNKRWGTNLTLEDYDEHWAKVWQIDNKETEERASEYHKAGVFGTYRHFEEAKPVLESLTSGYRLVIVTSRRKELLKETTAWINKNFKGIFDDIIFAGFWDEITDHSIHRTKAEICQELSASYLIDDQLKHCYGAAKVGIKSLLYGDYTWNRTSDLPDNVIRVKDWLEVKEFFNNEIRLQKKSLRISSTNP